MVLLSLAVLTVFACQRSAGISDDTESASTDIVADTNGTDSETETDSGTALDTAMADTALDTGVDTTVPADPVENEWVFIEGDSFEMGAEGSLTSNQPIHTVTVPSFEILKTEVTAYQYRLCVEAGVCSEPHEEGDSCARNERNNWLQAIRLNYPINCLDYFQAAAYCVWLGGRLPSESEWEYVARGGGQDISFPWGDEWPDCHLLASAGDPEEEVPLRPCWSGVQPVCSKPEGNSSHGLCDMAGNCAEWVADRVEIFWGYADAPTDGSAWIVEDFSDAVVRGGGVGSGSLGYFVFRRSREPADSNDAVSVTARCARDVD